MIPSKLPSDDLLRIVHHAYNRCSAYRQLYDVAEVDIDRITDIAELPIVTPRMLFEDPLGFRAQGEKPFRVAASSGTLNRPKLMFRTSEDFDISVNAQVRLMKMSGIRSNDVVGIVQPFDIWGYGNISLEATKALGGLAVPIGQASNETAYLYLNTCGVTAVDIASSRFLDLTDLAEQKPPTGHPPIRTVMLAGEAVSDEQIRHFGTFWDAQVFSHYGSEETDGLGGTCDLNDGIHVFDDLFIFEVIDDLNRPVAPGEVGQLVVTSLYHRGTPLVRYRLGDLVCLRQKENCRCGLTWPRIDVLGKSDDLLWLKDSVKLYAYQIDSALKAVLPGFLNFQAVCTSTDSADLVTVYVQYRRSTDSTDLAEKLLVTLKRCSIDVEALVELGALRFELHFTDRTLITTRRGKTRHMIDSRNQQPHHYHGDPHERSNLRDWPNHARNHTDRSFRSDDPITHRTGN